LRETSSSKYIDKNKEKAKNNRNLGRNRQSWQIEHHQAEEYHHHEAP
jgi:hypothetical protein